MIPPIEDNVYLRSRLLPLSTPASWPIGRAMSRRRRFRDVMCRDRAERRLTIPLEMCGWVGAGSTIDSRRETCGLHIHRLPKQHTWERRGLCKCVSDSESAANREGASGSGDRDLGVWTDRWWWE